MEKHSERIAVLESEVKALKDHQGDILVVMHEIKSEMTRYKGFLGGIAFIVSGLGVAVTLGREWIFKHWN